jgi:outer membrane protein OmpA-like peptidoglycan-associated protein
MPHRDEDATVWIGYSDFLVTLVILFFVIIATLLVQARSGDAEVIGTVRDGVRGGVLRECPVHLGARQQRTTDGGTFSFTVAGLGQPEELDLGVRCPGYADTAHLLRVTPGDTLRLTIVLNPVDPTAASDTTFVLATLPGDFAFGKDSANLKRVAIDSIVRIGLQLRAALRHDEWVAVQGHTDDLPFPPGAGKDNWVLSGERAAAAARILTDPVYGVGIPECQVTIMGFGGARPAVRIAPGDSPETRREKRDRNRRIEFRRLRGAELAGGTCG